MPLFLYPQRGKVELMSPGPSSRPSFPPSYPSPSNSQYNPGSLQAFPSTSNSLTLTYTGIGSSVGSTSSLPSFYSSYPYPSYSSYSSLYFPSFSSTRPSSSPCSSRQGCGYSRYPVGQSSTSTGCRSSIISSLNPSCAQSNTWLTLPSTLPSTLPAILPANLPPSPSRHSSSSSCGGCGK